MEGGQGGRWGGGGHQRAVWATKDALFFWLPLKPNNWSDLAGDEGGGMGGGVGRWPMEGGQGGRWGGAPESSVGATSYEGGGMGEAWGGGPCRAGKGGRWGGGGAPEQQKVHWFTLLGSLKNLTTGLIWLVTRLGGWGGGVGRWPMEGESREQLV